MSAVIRPTIPSDIPAITRIYAEAVEHGTASFELEPPDETEMARRMQSLMDGGFPYLASEVDGVLVGYAPTGSVSRTRSTSTRARTAKASGARCFTASSRNASAAVTGR